MSQSVYSSAPMGSYDRLRDLIVRGRLVPGTPLIVAHGGVHWAACCIMDIDQHDWIIDNCIVTHFSLKENGRWMARKLNEFALINES